MSLMDKIDNKIGESVDSIFSKFNKGDIKPVDILSQIKSTMDKSGKRLKNGKFQVPNIYIVKTSSRAFDNVEKWLEEGYKEKFERKAKDYADRQDYYLTGDLRVEIVEDYELKGGKIVVMVSEGELDIPEQDVQEKAPKEVQKTNKTQTEDKQAYLIVGNSEYLLIKDKTSIGRSSNNDITLQDPSISRVHAFIYKNGDNYILEDNKSTNGVKVENHIIQPNATLVNNNKILIGRLGASFIIK